MRKILSVLFAALMVLRCMDDDQRAGVCSETQNQCGGTASVTGRVLDPAGAPAAGAEVELYLRGADLAKRGSAAGSADAAYAKGTTDAEGRYAFRRLPAGDWLMKCVVDTLGVTQEFSLRDGEKKESAPATLVDNGIILGRVDRSIVQQGDGNVAILNEIGQQVNITVNGDFVFDNVPVYNTYTITILSGGKEVPVTGLEDKVIKVEPGKTLSVDSSGVKDVTGQAAIRFVVADTTLTAGDTLLVVPQFTGGAPAAYSLSLRSHDSAIVAVSGSRIVAVKAGTVQVTATVAGAESPYAFKVAVVPAQDAWKDVLALGPNNGRVVHADFLDGNTGYVVASNRRVLKTRDGGATWDTLRIQSGSGTYGLVAVEAVDPEVVYAVTQHPAGILRSLNGGVDWDSTFTGRDDLAGAQFLDRDRGFVWGARGVYWTEDGARTLVKLDSGATVVEARFLGPDTGYVVMDDNRANTILVKRTFDGGKTWTTATFPSSTLGKAEGLAVRDAGTVVLVGERSPSRGVALMSTDSGATWTPVALPAPMSGIVGSASFLPDGSLFLAGYTGSAANPTVVARSGDLGRTWTTERFDGEPAFYQSIQFVSRTTAFAWSGNDGIIRRTETGGFAANR